MVINMSSGGVLIAFGHEMSAGTPLELSIEWPAALDGQLPQRLVAMGKVVRCQIGSFAVGLDRHYFQIKGGAEAGARRKSSNY
jgi:hypothetical protein